MRTLSTHAAAAALGVDRKQIDNVLAREGKALVSEGRRGKSRRIPVDVLERIAIALILARDLGVAISKGLELAGRLVQNRNAPVPIGSLGTFSFDVATLRRKLEGAVDEALESVVEPPRGRPRAGTS